ncbi:type VII secretion target [Nocardia tengchongensis]|uniref:type VII secretion target n=1 Tax=Nocardia tengchongensis TaxID=2055889 RepID=UPI0036811B31
MAEGLNVDPQVLRRLAAQHDQVAEDIKNWSKKPEAWLRNFEKTYGAIADKVRSALVDYYNAREQAGLSLARQHTQTAESLRQAALDFEASDQHGASAINRGQDPAPSGAGHPVGAGHTPIRGGFLQGSQPETSHPDPATAAGGSGRPGVSAGGAPVVPADPTGHGDGTTPTTITTPPDAAPPRQGLLASGDADPLSTPATAADTPAAHATPTAGTPGALPGVSATADPRGPVSPGGEGPVPVAVPATAPLAAAVDAARDRDTGTGHVLNESVNEDLVLARALLGAVLAAADSAVVGLSWAVAVLRGRDSVGVFLTSNEGRGWLPAGLYLPELVSTPWGWDELLGAEVSAAWEGIADPARMLAEFARAAGPGADAAFTALASSATIDAGLRAALPDVAMADLVAPAYDVDLREPKPGTIDRLGLTRSVTVETLAAVPDSGIMAHCLDLAVQAHTQLGQAAVIPPQTFAARQARTAILETFSVGGVVSARQWDELRDADDLLAATMLAHRADTARVDLGALRPDTGADLLRAMVFERRASELLLLLATEPNRQMLRDAAYAYEQIITHPRYVEPLAPITTTTPDRAAVTTAPATTVAPDAVTAGPATQPPSGAIAPPDGATPPPVTA